LNFSKDGNSVTVTHTQTTAVGRTEIINTIPKWRTGRVQMGRMVAERLFNLLPPRMPLGVKYKLVEGLWHHVGPSSKHRIRVRATANVAEVIELARSKITEFVVDDFGFGAGARRGTLLIGAEIFPRIS
jgi:hypothetical protein